MNALPTLRQLQFFLALVQRQSFSKAAEDCLVSQSTLSSAIKELEALLETQLVDRSTRVFGLTPAGEDVARRASEIMAHVEDMRRAVADRRPLEGPFHLGVIPTIAPFLLPRAAAALEAAYPNLQLYLREDRSEALVERMASGALDAALLAFPYEAPGIDHVEIGRDAFVLAAPEGHPFAARKTVSISDLKKADILLLEDGHCLRDHAIEACKLRDPDTAATFGATSLFTLIQMVRAGLGVTLLPEMAVTEGLSKTETLAILPFESSSVARTIGVAWRRGSGRGEEARAVAKTIAAVF